MRSRRSSRPSWSSRVLTLAAAGSLSTTFVVEVSCTVMSCPPTSESAAAARPAAGQHRRGGASSTVRRRVDRRAAEERVSPARPRRLAGVKLRLPGRRNDAASTPDASDDLTDQLVRSSGKGRPTPKRSEAQGRRTGPPPPPPTTRKEAYKRTRENQAANRGTA